MLLLPFLLFATRIQPDAAAIPYRQPQLAAAHGQVDMTFGAGSTIYFTSSSDEGQHFAPPTKVGDLPSLHLGRHRGPRLAILKDALVISAISNDLTVWRSTDHGKNWSRTGVINDVPGATREGLHAMAADSNGNLFAVWLDLRTKGTQLYGAKSTDGGLTWSKNVRVYTSPDGTICQCCDPSLAFDKDGRVWVMWRNVIEGSRDMYVTSSADGIHFDAARKIGTGTWKLNACPMDGGGLAVDHGGVVSAWRREGNVFLTEPGHEEKQIGTGKDIALAQSTAGPYVAWTQGSSIEMLRPSTAAPEMLSTQGAYVNLVALPGGGVVAAWESTNGIETKRIQ
jgi:hypothetical protein